MNIPFPTLTTMHSFSLFFSLSFLSLLLPFSLSSSSSSSSLLYQAQILLSLKNSFTPPHPPSLSSWTSSNSLSLCSWPSIQCNSLNTSIISIDISNLNISCILPPQIQSLSSLRLLNISSNHFTGNLNWDFTNFNNLSVFDAYNNEFHGPLPINLTRVPTLTHLDLGGNYFSGEIPASFGSRLEYLSLAGNDLRGYIPAGIGNLRNLRQLRLGYYNEFSGGIPPEIGNLVNLVHLDMSSCGLKGEIPKELGFLKKIDTLFLQTNQISGHLPPQLGNLSQLKYLDLSNNQLSGEIPGEFCNLKSLVEFNLFINKLHGQIPNFISNFPDLQVLQLWRNNFTGSIPSNLGENSKLTQLDLSTNKLTGQIPKSICKGKTLKVLILLNNFLFGPLPSDLAHCDSLSRVRIGQNYLTGPIPTQFLYLPELNLVELQNNYLTGPLPEGKTTKLGSKLTQINLSNNRLTGPIPNSIGYLSNLQNLYVNENRISGRIPPGIGKLKNLLKLDISRNNFSGKIPPEIGDLHQLTYLDLSQNQLSGPIPSEISQIKILNYLNLSFNQLNQTIPKEIGSIKSLTSADFSHNNFSGLIPQNGQFSIFNYTSFLGNPLLCVSSSKTCNNAPNAAFKGSTRSFGRLKLILTLGLVGILIGFGVLVMIKMRNWKTKLKNSWKIRVFQKVEFEIEDIVKCISEGNIIGKGGAGVVYKGTLPSGEQVAIKKLLGMRGVGSSAHDHGLSAEIQTLGKIRHRNIVRLLGFCTNRETNLLVYEYMPNGSLGEALHGKRGGQLKWETRLSIAIEAAKGLCYLHHDCSPLIVHRDVKSNNILLSSDFEAHVADFGLAKFLQENGTSECMSAIAGSYGYIAPEYAYTLKVDEKSDVYSYGVVLLELLTGKKPVGDFGEEGMDVVQWTRIQTGWAKEKVANIIDDRLRDVPISEAMQVFFVAMLCVQEHSVERPTMREVVQMLVEAKQHSPF